MDDDVMLMDPDPQVVRVVRVQVPFADVFAVTAKVWLANVLMLWLVLLIMLMVYLLRRILILLMQKVMVPICFI